MRVAGKTRETPIILPNWHPPKINLWRDPPLPQCRLIGLSPLAASNMAVAKWAS